MSDQPDLNPVDGFLDSWKAIAAYLNRDARTVMRWEKTEGLPVHRHRHSARNSVYAYRHELDAWRETRRTVLAASRSARPVSRVLAIAAMVVGAVLSAGGGRFTGPLAAMQGGESASVDRPLGWPDNARNAMSAAMSPDGRYVSYIPADPETDLHVRDLQTGLDRRLTRIFGDGGFIDYSAISHDSTRVAFSSKDVNGQPVPAKLRVVPLTADDKVVPQVIFEGAWADPKEWTPDDTRIVVAVYRTDKNVDIGIVTVDTGELRVLKTVNYPGPGYHIRMSPDAAYIAYDARAAADMRQRDIRLVSTADTKEDVLLLGGPSSDTVVGWSPDGRHLVFESDRDGSNGLWAVPVARDRTSGDPIPVKTPFDGDPISMTAAGALLYESSPSDRPPPTTALLVATVDPQTGQLVEAPWFAAHDRRAASRSPRWSADGASLAYFTSRPAGRVITILSVATGIVREVPLNLGYIWTYEWAPDGQSFVFRCTDLQGREGVFLADATTGAVTPVALRVDRVVGQATRRAVGYYQPRFSADSRKLYYIKNLYERSLVQEIERDLPTGEERVLRETRWPATPPAFQVDRSPDRRFVVRMQLTPTSAIYLEDAATGDVREIFRVDRPNALDGNLGLRWMPDGRAMLVRVAGPAPNERTLWWVPVDGSPPHTIDIGRTDMVDSGFAVHPDGRQIAFLAGDPIVSKTPSLHQTEFRLLEHFLPEGDSAGGPGRFGC